METVTMDNELALILELIKTTNENVKGLDSKLSKVHDDILSSTVKVSQLEGAVNNMQDEIDGLKTELEKLKEEVERVKSEKNTTLLDHTFTFLQTTTGKALSIISGFIILSLVASSDTINNVLSIVKKFMF